MATRQIEGSSSQTVDIWRTFQAAASRLFDELDRRLQADAGISFADYGLLARLSEADEWGLRMSDLAVSAAFSRSRISHAISRLEKQGWVERRSCPTDRRGSFSVLTNKGRTKLQEAEPIQAEVIKRHLLDPLSNQDADNLELALLEVKASFGGDSTEGVS
jgi:DNA-binding MarR family transcriptional regulator